MPRKTRLFIPDQPQHVVVRGHNREPIFARNADFRFMYQCLYEASVKYGLQVHAWVFMHNHLHLLATPELESSLPRVMQSLGRRYAQFFNRTYRRTGSLWEGRYKSALVGTERYLLSCYRYIELNPVRAGLTQKPEDYAYSSYRRNALGKSDKLVTSHVVYKDLVAPGVGVNTDSDPLEGLQYYRSLFSDRLSHNELSDIRRATQKNGVLGNSDFQLKVARLVV